jgi:branched-subunit amino acid aminotransferase/4-amino-4-deoxychorismate lyase
MFDMRLNAHSRLNLITALIQAIKAGADEALMLDPHGFVSSCNATNVSNSWPRRRARRARHRAWQLP